MKKISQECIDIFKNVVSGETIIGCRYDNLQHIKYKKKIKMRKKR